MSASKNKPNNAAMQQTLTILNDQHKEYNWGLPHQSFDWCLFGDEYQSLNRLRFPILWLWFARFKIAFNTPMKRSFPNFWLGFTNCIWYKVTYRDAPIPQFHFRYRFRYSIFSIGRYRVPIGYCRYWAMIRYIPNNLLDYTIFLGFDWLFSNF